MDFAVSADHWVKLKEGKKRDKYLDLARELKKQWKKIVTVISIVVGAFGKETGRHRNQRTSRDHLDNIMIKIGQNTEKSHEDFRRFIVIQRSK